MVCWRSRPPQRDARRKPPQTHNPALQNCYKPKVSRLPLERFTYALHMYISPLSWMRSVTYFPRYKQRWHATCALLPRDLCTNAHLFVENYNATVHFPPCSSLPRKISLRFQGVVYTFTFLYTVPPIGHLAMVQCSICA